jgi:hypothetical protein
MIGTIVAVISVLKRLPFVFWVMDVQPDEAITAGYLKEGAMATRVFRFLGALPLHRAKEVVVLDRFMRDRVSHRLLDPTKVSVAGLWPIVEAQNSTDSSAFRARHGFGDRTVVMYSGNHSVCHPLDTLLGAAIAMGAEDAFLFAFVGGGVRKRDVAEAVTRHSLSNTAQLPYQPQSGLQASLSAADIHIVIMGNEFVGLVHPSKIYGIFAAAKPFICIGPANCHIADMIKDSGCGARVDHGDVDGLVQQLRAFGTMPQADRDSVGTAMRSYISRTHSEQSLIAHIEGALSRAVMK